MGFNSVTGTFSGVNVNPDALVKYTTNKNDKLTATFSGTILDPVVSPTTKKYEPFLLSGATQAPPPTVIQPILKQSEKPEAQLQTIKVTPIKSQPTAPPKIGFDSSDLTVDAYRNGSTRGQTGAGETMMPRTLGERDTDQVSYITLSAVENGKELISAYSRFFLQSVSESEQEKYQVVETFTGYYAFFYGKRPPVYRYSGILLSDPNFAWNNDFKFVYENYFRGTKAAEYAAQVLMVYDNRIVSGYPLSLTMQQDATIEKGVQFSMDILVVDHTPTQFSSDVASLLAEQKRALTQRQADILAAVKQTKPASTMSILAARSSLGGRDASLSRNPASHAVANMPSISGVA